jgi:ubiquinol-cytochrome c reductase cytochrome c subunit
VTPRVALVYRAGPLVAIGASVVVAICCLTSAAATSPRATTDVKQIFLSDCAVCHGADAAGTSRGPSLQGVGEAAVDYQLSTGRMPLDSPDATPTRRTPKYDGATIAALVAYIAGIAPGGPGIPTIDVSNADIAAGGEIYRAQCAACHQWAGAGGALEDGNAPSLRPATPTQIAEAVRTGPGAMPVFGEQAISDDQLVDLAGYVRSLDDPDDAGGAPLWHLGPLPEGAVALVAVAALAVVLRMIGTRT